MKRGWQQEQHDKKRRKLNFDQNVNPKTSGFSNGQTVLDGQVVPKLDQSKPEHSRRIQQRRRMIMYGKNTVGYDEYIRRIPKHKRKPRCPEQPSTPDHTVDIPTRRWQGMVKAWRKALHNYDPPDLENNKEKGRKQERGKTIPDSDNVDKKPAAKAEQSVQEKQIAEATSKGLLVQFAPSAVCISSNAATSAPSPNIDDKKGKESPHRNSSAVSPGVSTGSTETDVLDEEEERYQRLIQLGEEEGTDDVAKWGATDDNHNGFLEDDSDDDLL